MIFPKISFFFIWSKSFLGNILSNGNYYAAHTTGLEPLNANNVIDQTDGHLNYALIFNPNGSLYYSVKFKSTMVMFQIFTVIIHQVMVKLFDFMR